MKKIFIIATIFLYFSVAQSTLANGNITINEFLVDPSPQQVELYNRGESPIDISGWYIDDSGGSTYFTVPSGTTVSPASCVTFSFDFNFNITSEDTIRLFDSSKTPTDSSASTVDSYSYSSSPGSNVSFMRQPDGDGGWTTGAVNIGQKNAGGGSCLSAGPTPTPGATTTPSVSPTPPSTSYDEIYISEAQVNPLSGQEEWVELYNNNDTEVMLTGWYVDDGQDSGSSPKVFSLTIPAKGYGVYALSSSMFNNDEDIVRLLNSDQEEVNSFSYEESVSNQTVGPITLGASTFCHRTPSRGMANSSCLASGGSISTTSRSSSPTPTSKPKTSPATSSIRSSSSQSSSRSSSSSQLQKPVTKNGQDIQEDILGESTEVKNDSSLPWVKSLSFTSFSYSLLSIGSILLKLRK